MSAKLMTVETLKSLHPGEYAIFVHSQLIELITLNKWTTGRKHIKTHITITTDGDYTDSPESYVEAKSDYFKAPLYIVSVDEIKMP